MGLENPIHIMFLLVILLLVFGAKRLPEMGKSLGSGIRGFKGALTGDEEPAGQLNAATAATPAAATPVASETPAREPASEPAPPARFAA